MTMRYYSSVAAESSLNTGVSPSATALSVSTVQGFPINYPYTLSIDADNSSAELVEVTAAAGTNLTVVRGVDGTTAVSHSLGAVVRHDHSARDFRDSRDHEAATTGIHGLTGSPVGTTDTQTLTNKDLSSGNTLPANLLTTTGTQTVTNKNLASGTNTFPSSFATLAGVQTLTNKDLSDVTNVFPVTVVTTGGTQSLINKNLGSSTNIFPSTLVTLTGHQTLTNKVLSNPTISSPDVTTGTFVNPAITRNSTVAKVPYKVAFKSDLDAIVTPSDGDFGTTSGDGSAYTFFDTDWNRLALKSEVDVVSDRAQSGTTIVPVGTGSTEITKTITFPVPFASTPIVTCSPVTSRPAEVFATPTTVSATQVTFTVRNNVGAFNITVNWHAILS